MTGTPNCRTLEPFVADLEVGSAVGHLNLTLVPLRGERRGHIDYILAADAIEAGQLAITEVSEGGSVPELLVTSGADTMILLLDGEELVGAKQNRILNTTILLPPKAKTKIPVSCVEQGRWDYRTPDFKAGGYSPAKLRAAKSRAVSDSLRRDRVARSDQGEVWDEVAASAEALDAHSPTMAMHDAVEQRRDVLDGYVNALGYPDDARGVVAAVNGRFAAIDLFDRPATLERVWPRLVGGYTVDALARSRQKDASAPFTANAATAVLEHLSEITCDPMPTVGVGEDWRFQDGKLLGQALVAEETCLHLSAFPADEEGRQTRGPRIQPPSRRRRRSGPDIVY